MVLDLCISRLVLATGICLSGCRSLPADQADAADPSLTITPMPGPSSASTGSTARRIYPRLSGGADQLVLSWTEVIGDEQWALCSSRLQAGGWSPAAKIAEGEDWFVNWADIPGVVAGPEGLFAHWLARDEDASHAYHVEYSTAAANGPWSAPQLLHEDRSGVEHGFVTALALTESFFSVWLDGRQRGSTKLMGRSIAAGARAELGGEIELDGSTCSCCPTTAVLLRDGSVLVAYRDRSPDEVRDIALVRGIPGEPGSWSEGRVQIRDGWRIPGCPVNGPALAVGDDRIAMAWFTMGADEKPRVRLSFSVDGEDFAWASQVDDGLPGGRVSIAAVPGRDAFVVGWLEVLGDRAQWRVRLVEAGVIRPSVVLADVSGGRPDGMLTLAAGERDVFAAWTETDTGAIGLARIQSD